MTIERMFPKLNDAPVPAALPTCRQIETRHAAQAVVVGGGIPASFSF